MSQPFDPPRLWPPSEEFYSKLLRGDDLSVHCRCGHIISEPSIDQRILSMNWFVRLPAASNYVEGGTLSISPGHAKWVAFKREIGVVAKVHLGPTNLPALVQESQVSAKGMLVVCPILDAFDLPGSQVIDIMWSAYGLVDHESLPNWYTQFYAAMTQHAGRLYKAALLDYAVAFELFLEEFLSRCLTSKYGDAVSKYLLHRSWRVEERCKDLLELAIGHPLTERSDIYQPWDQSVRQLRNALSHGKRIRIDEKAVEQAHQAVYQAIRWIESVGASDIDA